MGDRVMFNSKPLHDDPTPWKVHEGLGNGSYWVAEKIGEAVWEPREFRAPNPSDALWKFRRATTLLGVGAFYNARAWLNFMQEFPGHLESDMRPDELTHLRAVLQRLVNVYGEA